ncbi:hypothetical protein ACOBR2_06640 [Telmatobacter bradus]|uniref:hypothetical protein n=1 Tax=Telmatobacter bradus TaxID=474953 RepID=UPI003B4356A5
MKFDLQDALLLVGVASIVGGIAFWSRPAALVIFGLFCLAGVRLMGRAQRPDASTKGNS